MYCVKIYIMLCSYQTNWRQKEEDRSMNKCGAVKNLEIVRGDAQNRRQGEKCQTPAAVLRQQNAGANLKTAHYGPI